MTKADWQRAAELAGFAPSIHNTQPWRLVVQGEAVELWADRSRAVPLIDPTGRQLVVSCGAALEQLRIALAAQGHDAHLTLAPNPDSPDLLAILRLSDQPADPVDYVLAPWITRRATVRGAFESRPIPAEVVDRFHAEVSRAGAWLRPVVKSDDLIALSVLLSHADESERADAGYLEELAAWRHRASLAHDGIPDAAVAVTTGRHTSLALRDFTVGASAPTNVEPDDHTVPVDERPFVVVVGTDDDGLRDWLTAGRAVARLLLRATADGVVASPLNQVIDDPTPRQQLRAQLGLLGQPQMVLRMGYGSAVPRTRRRPVSEYLTIG